MGATSILKIRYPEPTARVRDGATAMRTLAEDVDAARLDFYEMNSGSSATLTTAAWSLAGVGNVVGSRGTGIVQWGSNLGLKVTRAGRYLICGFIETAANATGRRGLGFTTTPASPTAPTGRRVMQNALATGVTPLMFSMPVTLSANDGIGLMVYQDSGGTLAGTQAYLSVTEI